MIELEGIGNPYRRRFGAVALLDALGVGTMSVQECEGFLRARDDTLENSQNWTNRIDGFGKEIQESLKRIEIATFGDSLLISWDLPEAIDDSTGLGPELWLTGFGFLMSSIVAYSLAQPIGWRGAVSLGEFIKDGATIIGPAVFEAARLYEKADWIGIVAAPSFGMALDRLNTAMWRNGEALAMDQWFMRYPAPFKADAGGPTETWCVAWPAHVRQLISAGEQLGQAEGDHFYYFNQWIDKFPKPPGTEAKYENTKAYFDWYWKTTRNWGDIYGNRPTSSAS